MFSEFRAVNYRKFKEIKLDLSKVNVFIGPNGGGKSTLSNSVYSLATIVRLGLGAAFPQKGLFSFNNIINFDEKKYGSHIAPIVLGVSGDLGDGISFDYDIAFNQDNNSPTHFYVQFEGLNIKTPNENMSFSREGSSYARTSLEHLLPNYEKFWPEEFSKSPRSACIFEQDLELNRANNNKVNYFLKKIRNYFKGMTKYQFNPTSIKSGFEAYDGSGLQPSLKFDGENLAQVIQYLEEERRGDFVNLKQLVREYSEGGAKIVDLKVENVEGKAFVNFYEETDNGKSFEIKGPFVSDGIWVFTAFATLANLYQRPTWSFFEEPEAYLHPHRLSLLAKTFKSLAKKGTQVAISTHNPHFLDEFKDAKANIIVARSGNLTSLTDVENYEEILKNWSLGEAWFSGLFESPNP